MLRVIVTKEDIKAGKKNNPVRCPVSYALQRVFPDYKVVIYGAYAFVHESIIELPNHIEYMIVKFDKGEYVKPTEFELPVPPSYLKYKEIQ